MKYLLTVPMALAFSATAALASGPSVPHQMHVQPHTAIASAPVSWSGFYAGAALGYGSTNYDLDGSFVSGPTTLGFNLPDLGGQGGLLGLQFGYNQQVSDRLVLGLQLDGVVTGISNDTSLSLSDGVNTVAVDYDLSPRTIYTLAGRVGYLTTPDTMFYGLVGYSRANFRGELEASDPTGSVSDSYSFSLNGVAVGLGMETRIARNTTLGVEYRYTQMQRYSFFDGPAFGGDLDVGFDTSIHTARVFLNVHF